MLASLSHIHKLKANIYSFSITIHEFKYMDFLYYNFFA